MNANIPKKNRPLKYKVALTKRPAAIQQNVKNLIHLYTQRATTTRNSRRLIDLVISQYADRDILRIETAGHLAHLAMINDSEGFQKLYGKILPSISKQVTLQIAKKTAQREENKQVVDELVRVVDRQVHRATIKTKNWESEAPTSEVQFVRAYKGFNEAWRAGYKHLINAVEQHLTKKQPNLKLYIGMQYTVIKQAIDHEDPDPDDVIMVHVGVPKVMYAKTKSVNVYNKDSVKPII